MSRHARAACWLCGAILLLAPAACSDKSGTGPGSTGDVDSYLRALPDWSSYSPPVQDAPAAPVDAPVFTRDTVPVDSTPTSTLGQYTTRQNVIYACQNVPYSVTKTPQQLVMYSPNPAYLWPGAFIQGKSHRDGAGALLPLTIAERTPINVSIPGLPTGQNFRTVSNVNQAEVAAAIGEMIGNATADNLNTGSTSYFKVETFHSEQEFALGIGLSGRYLGWKARTQANTSTKGSQNVVSVQFSQRMYDVVVAPPQTPAGFFSPEFTEAKLQEQVNLKRIGADNLPVYVSKVTYGRMMMFTMKSSASVSEMKGIVQLSYSALGNGASATLTAKQKNILNQSEIEIFSMGGADSATAAMIRSGDWRSYFTVSAPLSTAVPMSYELTNLGDGSTASVGETTDYTVRTCQELSQVPGQMQFLPGQNIPAPVASPYDVMLADVNGDQRLDLIWNHRSPTVNQVAVALAGPTGTFGSPAAASHTQPAPSEGWSNYAFVVGDVTGDGRADLVWNYLGTGANKLYVARALSGGGFAFDAPISVSTSNWSGFKLHVADVSGDGAADLVWNRLTASNETHVGRSNGDGTFAVAGPFTHPVGGWTPYQLFTADLNRDGRQDLIWSNIPASDQPNRTYTALSLAAGGFQFMPVRDHSATCCWKTYLPLVADFDGDQIADIYWNRLTPTPVYIHRYRGNGSGGWGQLAGQSMGNAIVGYAPMTGDLNGDGRADMIWTKTGTSSFAVRVGLSDQNGLPIVSAVEQVHPATASFNLAKQFVGRVDADGQDDLVLVIPEATTSVYVGLTLP
jgi:hypothetical protein